MNKAIGTESLEAEIGRSAHELKRTGVAHPANAKDELSADNLDRLLRRVIELSTREVDNLIDELQGLRKQLETDRDRIESEIARHSDLSQGVTQLTGIISDNVKKLPNPTY